MFRLQPGCTLLKFEKRRIQQYLHQPTTQTNKCCIQRKLDKLHIQLHQIQQSIHPNLLHQLSRAKPLIRLRLDQLIKSDCGWSICVSTNYPTKQTLHPTKDGHTAYPTTSDPSNYQTQSAAAPTQPGQPAHPITTKPTDAPSSTALHPTKVGQTAYPTVSTSTHYPTKQTLSCPTLTYFSFQLKYSQLLLNLSLLSDQLLRLL